jgi:hypothetical protein
VFDPVGDFLEIGRCEDMTDLQGPLGKLPEEERLPLPAFQGRGLRKLLLGQQDVQEPLKSHEMTLAAAERERIGIGKEIEVAAADGAIDGAVLAEGIDAGNPEEPFGSH